MPGGIPAAWGEPHWENYNLLIRSDDNGMTWSKPELVISGSPEDDFATIDIQLWLDPLGRMWLFFAKISYAPGVKPTDPDRWVTWAMICENPDAVEADDGRIFLVYDCGRLTFKEIRMAQITEADIMAGKIVDHASYRARIISKAPGNPDKAVYDKKMAEWRQWLDARCFY